MTRRGAAAVLGTAIRLAATARVVRLVAAATRRVPAVTAAAPGAGDRRISVVVPARDEADRIGALLTALRGAVGVTEVIVVDDESSDGTGTIATAAGANVIRGGALPAGWYGKPWAVQQGVAAASGDWIVTFDADARPSPALPAALVDRADRDGVDLLTVAGSFECPTSTLRWLHPALLTTLVYRYPPPGCAQQMDADRQLANGQCMAMRRDAFLEAGGMEPVRGHLVEDVALARHLARHGWTVRMLAAPALLTVRMYEDAPAAVRGWGRSLSMPGVEPPLRRVVDLVTVAATQALPLPRLLTGRGDALDVVLLAVRIGTLFGTAGSYAHRGVAYWLSPGADVVAALTLAGGLIPLRRRWRGRRY